MVEAATIMAVLVKEFVPLILDAYAEDQKGKLQFKALDLKEKHAEEVARLIIERSKTPPAECKTCSAVRTLREPKQQQIPHGAATENPLASVGRHTWLMLHSAAEFYPDEPTETQMRRASDTVLSVIRGFPCQPCVEDAEQFLGEHPLDFGSKKGLKKSLCILHNHVSSKLGKPLHPCEP